MYPQGRVVVSLKACKSGSLYGHTISFFNLIFSKRYEYIISQELSSSINMLDILNLKITAVMTRGKILLGSPIAFSISWKPRICLFGPLVEVLHSFLFISINSTIFLFTLLLDELLTLLNGRIASPGVCHLLCCLPPFPLFLVATSKTFF